MSDRASDLNCVGHHQAERELRCFYLPNKDASPGLVDESPSWAFFAVRSPSFDGHFVLVAASAAVWAMGQDSVRDGLLVLLQDFESNFCLPDAVERRPPVESSSSIWILQAPDRSYHLVSHDDQGRQVSWTPLFSVDPTKQSGSVDALRLLFSVNADQGIEALEKYFWAVQKSVTPTWPQSLPRFLP